MASFIRIMPPPSLVCLTVFARLGVENQGKGRRIVLDGVSLQADHRRRKEEGITRKTLRDVRERSPW
jgi:hypothetical protein